MSNGSTRYFVRGLIELPIEDGSEYFGYGVWIETSEETAYRLGETWDDESAEAVEQGFLANELDAYPASMGLAVTLRTRKELPLVTIDDEHRLATDQRNGIDNRRADELAASIVH